MKRLCMLVLVMSVSVMGLFAPSAQAVPTPARSISVAGTAVEMYPAFAAGTERYGVTTTSATGGSLDVTATTADPEGTVLVAGRPVSGPTTVTGLAAGDEVSVIITDEGGTTAYSLMYLPAGFPRLDVTTNLPGTAPGLVALTLHAFEPLPPGVAPLPSFEAIVNRDGVPVYAAPTSAQTLDLKQQPNGELTVSRPTTAPGKTGTALVTLDDQFLPVASRDVADPLVNTDNHDGTRLADGSTILIGYEPNAVTGKTDATIQKLDANGVETFTWSSADIVDETTASPQVQNQSPLAPGDYAHINSVVPVEDGDVIASFRHLSSVLRIATVPHDGYEAGDIIWRLGGRNSDFTFVDDPFPGGPCAQHTASELPNGNILIFDNGSSGLCVDPADPTGPTVARGQTRVTEYALDTVAGTATLVWSYAPPSTYALFAGGARRVANGNTLIGWADERDALATEVNADKEVLWEVKTPAGTGGHKNYVTYRAEPITGLDDAIDPVITTTLPSGTLSYLQGTVVEPGVRCSDRGGSNLQSCSSPAMVDTSTPGTHTLSASAVDGAGNLTTLERTYTVRPKLWRWDAASAAAGSSTFKGVGILGSKDGQTTRLATRGRTGSVAGTFLVRNAGTQADRLALTGIGTGNGFTVRYLIDGVDRTTAIVGGTYRSASLAPGATVRVRVVVTKRAGTAYGAQRDVVLRASSVGVPSSVDRSALLVTARR